MILCESILSFFEFMQGSDTHYLLTPRGNISEHFLFYIGHFVKLVNCQVLKIFIDHLKLNDPVSSHLAPFSLFTALASIPKRSMSCGL